MQGLNEIVSLHCCCNLLLNFLHGIEEGIMVIKRVRSGCRERSRQKPDTRGIQKGSSDVFGFQRLLVVLEGEPLEILA